MLVPSTYVTTDGDHRLHQHFGIQHFIIPVMKCFDTPSHDPRNGA
jgi:hypothetical protein